MDSVRAKVLVIGPKRSGKTRIADFLAGHADAPHFEDYKPTRGSRILEFEQGVQSGKRSVQMNVELWDTSGDRQYEGCWPAILRDAQGVVLVYDPSIKEQEKDVELWYKSFAASLRLKPEQHLLFAHQANAVGKASYQAPRNLDRLTFLNTTLDSEDTCLAMKKSFADFLGHVAAAALDKSKADLDSQLQLVGN